MHIYLIKNLISAFYTHVNGNVERTKSQQATLLDLIVIMKVSESQKIMNLPLFLTGDINKVLIHTPHLYTASEYSREEGEKVLIKAGYEK
jgi:hypothetical protein